jgi:signal transduction histidine kinase
VRLDALPARSALAIRPSYRLDSLLRDVFGWLSDTLPKNVRLRLAIAEGEYSVLADPAQLQQLVTNLALDARDAMPRGGDLRIGLTSLMVERGKERPLPQMGAGRWVRSGWT